MPKSQCAQGTHLLNDGAFRSFGKEAWTLTSSRALPTDIPIILDRTIIPLSSAPDWSWISLHLTNIPFPFPSFYTTRGSGYEIALPHGYVLYSIEVIFQLERRMKLNFAQPQWQIEGCHIGRKTKQSSDKKFKVTVKGHFTFVSCFYFFIKKKEYKTTKK